MAQATALKTYDFNTNRESLSDVIGIVAQDMTPFLSSLKREKVDNTYFEWSTDDISTGSSNAQIEGADYSFSLDSAPSRTGAYTQIFNKLAKVSKTELAADPAGMSDALSYQIEKKLREIATDVEAALMTGTGNSGASGTAREIKGVVNWIATNVETGTGTGSEALTEDMYNDLLQTIWDAGGRPDVTYTNSFNKRKISAFSTSNTRNLEMEAEGRLRNYVSVYESDFGVQKIELEPFITASVVAVLQSDLWALAEMRPIKVDEYPSQGSYMAKIVEGEMGLKSHQEKGSGKLVDLTTS